MTDTLCKKTFWIYAVLFLSVTANVFLAGIVLGRYGAQYGAVSNTRAERLMDTAKGLQALKPETRERVKTAIRSELPQLKALRDDIRERRMAVRTILSQESYDKAELEQAFADMYKSVDALQLHGQKMVLQLADSMTPEERVNLLKALPKPGL